MSERVAHNGMVDECDEEKWTPEKDVSGRDNKKHLHPLNAVAFHSPEVFAHPPVLFQRSGSLKCVTTSTVNLQQRNVRLIYGTVMSFIFPEFTNQHERKILRINYYPSPILFNIVTK